MAKQKGKLIAFEGADGSGKTTQSKLLLEYLTKSKVPAEYISFPRYEESLWGAMVRRYLEGKFGGVDEVDPYLASLMYAGDRASAREQMRRWLTSGKIIVCNRYVGSNIGHMAAKIASQSEKSKFIDWLERLEYRENGIPKEDLVIFLYVPVDISWKLMEGKRLDIHEKDHDYLERVIDVYESYTKTHKNWVRVDCTRNGKILPPDEIHKKVLEVLYNRKILKDKLY